MNRTFPPVSVGQDPRYGFERRKLTPLASGSPSSSEGYVPSRKGVYESTQTVSPLRGEGSINGRSMDLGRKTRQLRKVERLINDNFEACVKGTIGLNIDESSGLIDPLYPSSFDFMVKDLVVDFAYYIDLLVTIRLRPSVKKMYGAERISFWDAIVFARRFFDNLARNYQLPQSQRSKSIIKEPSFNVETYGAGVWTDYPKMSRTMDYVNEIRENYPPDHPVHLPIYGLETPLDPNEDIMSNQRYNPTSVNIHGQVHGSLRGSSLSEAGRPSHQQPVGRGPSWRSTSTAPATTPQEPSQASLPPELVHYRSVDGEVYAMHVGGGPAVPGGPMPRPSATLVAHSLIEMMKGGDPRKVLAAFPRPLSDGSCMKTMFDPDTFLEMWPGLDPMSEGVYDKEAVQAEIEAAEVEAEEEFAANADFGAGVSA